MSDYILKFWPKEMVEQSKVDSIINSLKERNIIGEGTEFLGKEAFRPGELLNRYFDPFLELSPISKLLH